MKGNLKRLIITLLTTLLIVGLLPTMAFAASKKPTPGKVTLSKISAPAYNKVTIQWKKTSNATNYVVYYKKAGTSKWTRLTTVASNKTSYTHTSSKKYPIVVGQKYTYTVRAYNKTSKKYGSYNTKGLTVNTVPATVKLKKAALNSKKTAITVSWNKAAGNNYYVVYRKSASAPKWKKIATVKSSVLSYTDKNPVKGEKNTYTVRAYYSKTKVLGGYNKTGVSATMPAVKVTKLALNKTSVSLTKKGQTVQLTATITPNNATNKAVTWKSSNTKVATVSSTGKVTAIDNGTATITATAKDGSKKAASCKITVNIPPAVVNVTGVTVDANLIDLREKGVTAQVHATVSPANASNKAVTWTSSNNNVATVSSTGAITAVDSGTCTITATTIDGGKKASCQVTVTLPVGKIHSISLSDKSLALTARGQSDYIIAYVKKDDTIDTALTWSSSNNSIATVNSSGKVTAVSSGVCTITCASYYDSSVNATCTVYVELLEETHQTKVTVQGVTFDMKYFPKMITVDDSECLSVIPEGNINPADITYKIANGNAQLLCNSNTPNLYLNGTEQYIYDYYVSDWKNMMAYLSISYDPGMYLQYRVEIYSQLQTGSFPVSVYYKNTLISTCKVIITSTYEKAVEYRKWMDDLEKKAWTSSMTPQEKLLAIKDYIYDNYSYTTDGYMCNAGAQALLFAARDLGLNARYRFVGSNYDYQKGIGDVYYHFGSAFCGGHVCTIVTIDNENYIIETQGHPG